MSKKKFDREAMRITVDYNNMMRETLGERGLTADEQLYTEGPFDKVVTFLSVDRYRKTMPITM